MKPSISSQTLRAKTKPADTLPVHRARRERLPAHRNPLGPQLQLLPLNPVNRVLGQSLEEQFDAFHGANPHVYSALHSLAVTLKRRGAKKAGISQLFEVLRWQYALQTKGSEYRLNNNYRSFYARILNEEPELRGMFETRTLRWQRHRR